MDRQIILKSDPIKNKVTFKGSGLKEIRNKTEVGIFYLPSIKSLLAITLASSPRIFSIKMSPALIGALIFFKAISFRQN